MTILNERKKDLTNANIYNTDLKRYVKLLNVISNTTLALKDDIVESELSPIKASINTIKNEESTKSDEAKKYEREGFTYLFDKNLTSAMASFQKAEDSYNGYHSVYEIKMYLSRLKNDNLNWKTVYTKILNDLNYKLPIDIIEKLKLAAQ